MAKYRYNLYCDESGVHDGNPFYIGAIHCSPQRAEKLTANIQTFRQDTGCFREMKWTRVSAKMLSVYTRFVDIFFHDPYSTFVLGEMEKNSFWRNLAHSEDSRYLQAYWYFLERAMWGSARYALYLDDTSAKRYKYRSLHYVMNLPDIRMNAQKRVYALHTVNSSHSDIMQLVDVLLGAFTTKASASHKCSLSQHVKQHMNMSTKSGNSKMRVITWSAPQDRNFIPNI